MGFTNHISLLIFYNFYFPWGKIHNIEEESFVRNHRVDIMHEKERAGFKGLRKKHVFEVKGNAGVKRISFDRVPC